jgi:hypothetical protein
MKTAVLTAGQIAEQLGLPSARIAYIITRHRLKPVARVGIIRLFNEEQVQRICQELAQRRERRPSAIRGGLEEDNRG